jgi:hypothetical protein
MQAKFALFSAEHKLYGAMTLTAKVECTVAGGLVTIHEKRKFSSLLGFKKRKIAEVGEEILKTGASRHSSASLDGIDDENFFTAENSFSGLNLLASTSGNFTKKPHF